MRFGLLTVPMELKMSFIHDNGEEDVRSTLQIDGYNVEKYISRGSFGSIVRLIDAPTTVQAVKEIRWRSENAIDRENEQNFAKREYKIQQKLSQLDNNGFFLKTYDFRSVDGGFLHFMDFEEGEDLHNKMNCATTPAMTQNYFKQLAQALKVVHEHGVIQEYFDKTSDWSQKMDMHKTTMEHCTALLQKHVRLRRKSDKRHIKTQKNIKGPPTDVEHTFWKEATVDQPAYLQWIGKRYSENEVFRKDLLEKMLCHDPLRRLTIDAILAHDYLSTN